MSIGLLGALTAYLLTTVGAILMLRRSANGHIRFLILVIGLLPLCQTILMLREHGLWTAPVVGQAAEMVELLVSALCLAAVHLLNKESSEKKLTNAKLRLVEAEVPVSQMLNDVPPPSWLWENAQPTSALRQSF